MIINLSQEAQIILLSIKRVFKNFSAKYLELIEIFLKKLAIKLHRCFSINQYTINLKKGKQLLYKPIYSLK